MGWVGVCDELGDNAGLGDYFVIVRKTGDEAALLGSVLGCSGSTRRWTGPFYATYWVDFKVPWLPWCVQIDYDFLVLEAGFLECDVRTVCPWASMVGV